MRPASSRPRPRPSPTSPRPRNLTSRASSFLSTSSPNRPTASTSTLSPPRATPSITRLNETGLSAERNRHRGHGFEQRRSFFGIGEVLGVITNPGEVLRSLAESRKLLEEARQEMKENSERAQIPTSHTFSPLPGFFNRPNEVQALERALGGVPAFTVLFGASSVGKTALLRQVLSTDKYHVLFMDLRIAGFADLQSLYFSLAHQLESYFASLPELMGSEWGWDVFEKESWAFKHDRLAIEKRVEGGGEVKTSDVAHLVELFQSALLKYWEFEPMSAAARKRKEEEASKSPEDKAKEAKEAKEKGKGVEKDSPGAGALAKGKVRAKGGPNDQTEKVMREGWGAPAVDPATVEKKSVKEVEEQEEKENLLKARSIKSDEDEKKEGKEVGENDDAKVEEEEPKPPPKKIPVFFLDEAHKLPALIKAQDAMKCLLDSMLVLTKQDRLCHVLHSTSDSFYMHWLRQMNIMQHCHILSIGDCSKAEAYEYFSKDLLPHVPEELRDGLKFEELYKVFGGKLAHLADYTTEYVNCDGDVTPLESSHFLQAHSLLNLQLVHSMPSPDGSASSPGFQIYSPLANASPHAAPSPFSTGGLALEGDDTPSPAAGSDFSNQDLLLVMERLAPHPPSSSSSSSSATSSSFDEIGEIPYFPLCREIGARAVDGMVRGRILELRWSATVTEEGDTGPADTKAKRRKRKRAIGPVLVPTTSVIRFAMGEVLKEYADIIDPKDEK